jgi:hypothetical protein
VNALVAEDFAQAVAFSFHRDRLTAEQMAQAIHDYPGRLTLPPNSAYQVMEVYEHDNGSGAILDFFLWVDGEPSELMIQINATYSDGDWHYTLWDILVP